jgi:hypothetical protein
MAVTGGFDGIFGTRRGRAWRGDIWSENETEPREAEEERARVIARVRALDLSIGIVTLYECERKHLEGAHVQSLRSALAAALVENVLADTRARTRLDWALEGMGVALSNSRRVVNIRKVLHVAQQDIDKRPPMTVDARGAHSTHSRLGLCGIIIEEQDLLGMPRGAWAQPVCRLAKGKSTHTWDTRRCGVCESKIDAAGLRSHPEIIEHPQKLLMPQAQGIPDVLVSASAAVEQNLATRRWKKLPSLHALTAMSAIALYEAALDFAASALAAEPQTWLPRLHGKRGVWDETQLPASDIEAARTIEAAQWRTLLASVIATHRASSSPTTLQRALTKRARMALALHIQAPAANVWFRP